MKKFIVNHRSSILLVILLFFSLFSLWFSEKTSWGSPRDTGMVITSFFQYSIDSVIGVFNSTLNSFNELNELRYQHQLLLQRFQDLERQQSDLLSLQNENLDLKKALDFSLSIQYSNIPCKIIAKEPGVLFSAFVINKGYNNGIRSQMPVICIMNGQKSLVGKIGNVSSFSAQVIPVFDRRCNVAARLTVSRYEGLVQGSGNFKDNLQMIYMDPKAQSQINVGDIVCTSGLSSLYPQDIPIGKVTGFTVKPHASTLELEVESFVDFTRLEYVYVLDKFKE